MVLILFIPNTPIVYSNMISSGIFEGLIILGIVVLIVLTANFVDINFSPKVEMALSNIYSANKYQIIQSRTHFSWRSDLNAAATIHLDKRVLTFFEKGQVGKVT